MVKRLEWCSSDICDKTGYKKAGIYRIRLFKKGQPVKISRFRGIDDKGILSIGYSKNIEERRKQFVRSCNGKHGHSEGIQWWLITEFSNIGEQASLRFEFVKLLEEEAKEREKVELQNYFKKYLETPPLNATIPQRQKWFDELKEQDTMKMRGNVSSHSLCL